MNNERCSSCQNEKFIWNDDIEDVEACKVCKGKGYIPEKISNEKLDEITVKVATLLLQEGLYVMHNESLNYLRGQLHQMFTEWFDYSLDKNACGRHVIWQDLRDKLGIKNPFNE